MHLQESGEMYLETILVLSKGGNDLNKASEEGVIIPNQCLGFTYYDFHQIPNG